MPSKLFLGLATFLLLFVTGCMFSSSGVSVNNFYDQTMGEKKVAIYDTPYLAEMTNALLNNGFVVTPIPTDVKINELQNGQLDGSITRWGISLQTKNHGDWVCVFTNSNILEFTLYVKDLSNNQIVMSLEQTGSDGPCSTIEPVFPTLASKLSERWH